MSRLVFKGDIRTMSKSCIKSKTQKKVRSSIIFANCSYYGTQATFSFLAGLLCCRLSTEVCADLQAFFFSASPTELLFSVFADSRFCLMQSSNCNSTWLNNIYKVVIKLIS